ncbi:hypothetical protein [Aeoliella sp.]|uniref:hypothetical protein n=1 Tax=Aeoliella sp. TaxID=2795800 RepID=UPI003CCBCBAC
MYPPLPTKTFNIQLLRIRLLDALALLIIALVVSMVTYTWHYNLIEDGAAQWRDTSSAAAQASGQVAIDRYFLVLCAFYSASAMGIYLCIRYSQRLSVKQEPSTGIVAAALGLAVPLLSAPLFPVVPAWLVPGYPVLMLPLLVVVYCFARRRPGLGFAVFGQAFVWFVLANTYHDFWLYMTD